MTNTGAISSARFVLGEQYRKKQIEAARTQATTSRVTSYDVTGDVTQSSPVVSVRYRHRLEDRESATVPQPSPPVLGCRRTLPL